MPTAAAEEASESVSAGEGEGEEDVTEQEQAAPTVLERP
jgi:hypothetical protein